MKPTKKDRKKFDLDLSPQELEQPNQTIGFITFVLVRMNSVLLFLKQIHLER